jgi:protein SCO1/2
MKMTRIVWLLAAAALCAAAAGFYLARQLDRRSPQLASGTWYPQARAVAEFELQDVAGQPLTRASLQGQPTLVFFGFTHCPDVCPTTLLKLAQVRRQAGLAQLRVLFISVDPQRDSPQALGAYVHAFDPQFLGATGTPAGIAALASGFGVAVNRVELPGGDYTMDHSAVVFLLDDAASIVAIFTPPFDAAAMARDLQRATPYLKRNRSSG